MKRFVTLSISALLIAAMMAPSLEAQSRSGSNSRGGSNSRQTSGSTSSSRSSGSSSSSRSSNSSRQSTQSNNSRSSSRSSVRSTQRQQPQQQARPVQPQAQTRPAQAQTRPAQPQVRPSQSQSRSSSRQQQMQSTVGRPSGTAPRPSVSAQRPSGSGNNQGYSRAEQRRPQASRVQYRPVNHARPSMHPARREPIVHRSSYAFWNRGPHYYGYRVNVLPSHHVRHVHWGVSYYIVDNVYYRQRNGHYYVSRPPYGVVFNPVAESIAYAACRIAYYTSVLNTYSIINQNAELITQQNATIAANNALIAQQNQTIALNNELAGTSYSLANGLGLVQSYANAAEEYFYDDGVFFVKKADGSYMTMVPPAGALVQELPEDYEIKVLSDGNEYYVVDNTVFRLSVVDGAAYFEVIGQLT